MRTTGAVALACALFVSCSAALPDPLPPAPGPSGGGSALAAGKAFPGAWGFGASASGGRGGKVIHVTNLNADGKGSFKDAVRTPGPRVVVFDVAGKIPIRGHLQVRHGDVTIACQSAPGGGISFVGGTLVFGELDDDTPYESQRNIKTRNIVVRHCRFRDPAASVQRGDNADGVQLQNVDLAMFDHVSIAWAADESGAARRSRRITWQDCLITEPLINGKHSKGAHPYGPMAAYGTYQWSMGRCFLSNGWHRFPHMIGNNLDGAEPKRRSREDKMGPRRPPRPRSGRQREREFSSSRLRLGPPNPVFVFSGNTVYNVGGPEGIGGSEVAIGAHAVIENNAYWTGPDTVAGWLPIRGHDLPESDGSGTRVWLRGNSLDGVTPRDQRSLIGMRVRGVSPPEEAASRIDAPEPPSEGGPDLDRVGALPHDEIDARVLGELEARTGRQGAPWRKAGDPVPAPAPGSPIEDLDRDGMADAWERQRGRDPGRYDPWTDLDCNGWSDLEDYLNERAGDPRVPGDCESGAAVAPPPPPPPAPDPDREPPATEAPRATAGDTGIPCLDVVRFEARCQQSARGASIQARLLLRGTEHDGGRVTISIDGSSESVAVRGGRAVVQRRGVGGGSHTVRLIEPAMCAEDVPVRCSGR